MNPKWNQPWIPLDRIDSFIQYEPAMVILGLVVGAWLIYKLLLRKLSPERHLIFKGFFSNLTVHLILWVVFFALYQLMDHFTGIDHHTLDRLSSYVGALAIVFGAIVFVKACRILVMQYLFMGHMREGVPILLPNIFTLILSTIVGGWLISEVFNVRLAPLLATSAIFSVILGLALQDTLGNLFAGIALQFDKPYEIGDWVEVQSNGQKWVGQVYEISWRATVLIGFGEELLTIPNRVIAQAETSNFSTKNHPIIRSQLIRIPYGESIKSVKEILIKAALSVPSIRKHPAPIVLVSEAGESSLTFKLVYFVDNYGAQYMTTDQVLTAALEGLEEAEIPVAGPRLWLGTDPNSPHKESTG